MGQERRQSAAERWTRDNQVDEDKERGRQKESGEKEWDRPSAMEIDTAQVRHISVPDGHLCMGCLKAGVSWSRRIQKPCFFPVLESFPYCRPETTPTNKAHLWIFLESHSWDVFVLGRAAGLLNVFPAFHWSRWQRNEQLLRRILTASEIIKGRCQALLMQGRIRFRTFRTIKTQQCCHCRQLHLIACLVPCD